MPAERHSSGLDSNSWSKQRDQRDQTGRTSYTTRSLVTSADVRTWLAAAKLGRMVLSQFVRCEHSRWNTRVQNWNLVRFSLCGIKCSQTFLSGYRLSDVREGLSVTRDSVWSCRKFSCSLSFFTMFLIIILFFYVFVVYLYPCAAHRAYSINE